MICNCLRVTVKKIVSTFGSQHVVENMLHDPRQITEEAKFQERRFVKISYMIEEPEPTFFGNVVTKDLPIYDPETECQLMDLELHSITTAKKF